jgi:hypothetical protein
MKISGIGGKSSTSPATPSKAFKDPEWPTRQLVRRERAVTWKAPLFYYASSE